MSQHHLPSHQAGKFLLIPLLWATLAFYAPTLQFGFIWDDPIWYGHALGKAWWQTLLPTTEFQFYRPLTMLYFWLFMRSDGTVAIELLHWAQMLWHLVNLCLIYALGRELGLGRKGAWGAAALLAFFPFAYQAVSWAAPQQPLVASLQMGTWLTYLISRRTPQQKWAWRGASLALFGMALAVQESSVAVAIVPLWYELVWRTPSPDTTWRAWVKRPWAYGWAWALTYLLAGVGFGLLWLIVPRQVGITQLAMQPETAAYLAQLFIYPLLGRPWGYALDFVLSASTLLTLASVGVGGLLLLAHAHGRLRLALFGLGWAMASLVPFFVGLPFAYVYLGERLLYAPAAGGILLWSAALLPKTNASKWSLWGTGLVWLAIVGQSLWLVSTFQQMYREGIVHLQTAVKEMSHETDSALFLNFPDRYLRQRPFYPFGGWGVTLAPVVVELHSFVPLATNQSALSTSFQMPWLDTAARDNGPYQVDMRGIIIGPDRLYEEAQRYEAVYLSRYSEEGQFELQRVGGLVPHSAVECPLVRFDDIICLHQVELKMAHGQWVLVTNWSTSAPPPPHTTLFVHVQPPSPHSLVTADGDSWGGALPLTEWQGGHLIRDERYLPWTGGEKPTAVWVGLYNWVEGQRLPATLHHADGSFHPLPDSAYAVLLEE